MKTSFKSIVIAIVAALIATSVQAQTFHAIIACNTTDASIGPGMISDMNHMNNMVQTIQAILDCESDLKIFDGNTCTRANITNYINNMEVGRDDVILFFYSGHGTHAAGNAEDPWPQMCMNTGIESLFMPVISVDKLLANKQPKLRIILTDCCNVEDSRVSIKPKLAQLSGPTSLKDFNTSAIKKLFLENKGKVIMTSSKLGQYSHSCNYNDMGSIFTNYVIEAFDGIGQEVSPTWDAYCKAVHDMTLAYEFEDKSTKQEPYYMVSVNGSSQRSDDVRRIPSTSQKTDLFKALQTLVDHNSTEDQRLAKISDIQSKYFTSGAHVVTVGRNGTSKIMYEDVDDFLRRLALSSNIKQINILEGDNDGKNSIITVHEVRY